MFWKLLHLCASGKKKRDKQSKDVKECEKTEIKRGRQQTNKQFKYLFRWVYFSVATFSFVVCSGEFMLTFL